MVVRLDYATDAADYEEVITFHPEASSTAPLIMWRTENFVCLLPHVGVMRRYRTVAKALESPMMIKTPSTILTDIIVPRTGWNRGFVVCIEGRSAVAFSGREASTDEPHA
jgi:hypothetical protein